MGDLPARFPDAGSEDQALVARDSESVRMSSGLELRVIVPKFQVPVRFYWAYNPIAFESMACCRPRIALNPSNLPNGATLVNAINSSSYADTPAPDRRSMFRIAIRRTF